jgi:hypothetical protein
LREFFLCDATGLGLSILLKSDSVIAGINGLETIRISARWGSWGPLEKNATIFNQSRRDGTRVGRKPEKDEMLLSVARAH